MVVQRMMGRHQVEVPLQSLQNRQVVHLSVLVVQKMNNFDSRQARVPSVRSLCRFLSRPLEHLLLHDLFLATQASWGDNHCGKQAVQVYSHTRLFQIQLVPSFDGVLEVFTGVTSNGVALEAHIP